MLVGNLLVARYGGVPVVSSGIFGNPGILASHCEGENVSGGRRRRSSSHDLSHRKLGRTAMAQCFTRSTVTRSLRRITRRLSAAGRHPLRRSGPANPRAPPESRGGPVRPWRRTRARGPATHRVASIPKPAQFPPCARESDDLTLRLQAFNG